MIKYHNNPDNKCIFIDQCEAVLGSVYSTIYAKSVFSYDRIHNRNSICEIFTGTCYNFAENTLAIISTFSASVSTNIHMKQIHVA